MRILSLVLICLLITAPVMGAVENLDEVVARKARLATATWNYGLLQNAVNNNTWQPETLNYTDVLTSNEVWRLTYTPAWQNTTQDIASTHWGANGNRLMFHSRRATNAFAYANGSNMIWMLSNTDGSHLKPALNAPAHLTSMHAYIAWSPVIPDVFYSGYSNDGQGLSANVLYKATVSDTTIARSAYLTLPAGVSGIGVKKAVSGDGRKLMASALNSTTFFPLTVYPEASKALDDADGHSRIYNFDTYWGGTVTWNGYHDQYVTGAVNGADGIWNILMPETSATDGPFWRARLIGTGTSSAPTHTQDRTYPYVWGDEIEPVNTVTDNMNKPSPWCGDGSDSGGASCIDPSGHGSPDRWGRYLIGAKGTTENWGGSGTSFLDMRNHNLASVLIGYYPSHPDWEAWSDWSAASALTSQSGIISGPSGVQKIVTQNMNVPASFVALASAHTRYNEVGVAQYEANARPTQSPDGTKVLFNSTFLNASDEHPQLFWTVAYYPYPPEIKSAAKSTSYVRLTWDFNQGTAGSPNLTTPRTYAKRGWPHETNDRPPSPREIKQFRVWVSSDDSTWTPAGTTSYNNCSGTNECGTWTETAWTYDATQANNTTRYYAITSLEHSGLESRSLSNVWRVVLDGSGNVSTQAQQTAYPTAPGAKTAFYTTQPDAPTGLVATHQKSPATTAGQYTVEWSAPASRTLIRHYNIYAKDGSAPTATQQSRIASIPATADYAATGAFSYIDWAGNTAGTTQYLVSSVDYFGNETGVTPGAAVNGACGSVSGTTVASLTSGSANLCSAGTVASFTGTGGWTWGCNGLNGGTSTASNACSANITAQAPPSGGTRLTRSSGGYKFK